MAKMKVTLTYKEASELGEKACFNVTYLEVKEDGIYYHVLEKFDKPFFLEKNNFTKIEVELA